MTRLKTKILLALLATSFLYGGDSVSSENEFGAYKLAKPQTTYSQSERESACKLFGEGYRTPNIEELFYAPSVVVLAGEKSLYASSTRNYQSESEIYYYSFDNRDVNTISAKEKLYLVCFKEAKKESKRNLLWGKSEPNRMSFKEAKTFCEAKNERLPTANELFSLAFFKLSNEKEYSAKYGFTQPKYYWSSEANDDFSNTAIVVGFLRASVANSQKENKSFVRCVVDAK